MLQVALGQPEVILWSIAFEADQELWSLVWVNQSMGENIFYLKLFFTFHQLRRQCLIRGPHFRGVGVVGFQVFHILKWSESGEVWWDLHSDSVGPSELQHLEGF